MNNEESKALLITVVVVLVMLAGVGIGHAVTAAHFEREAVGNNAGHWTIVNGEAVFAWGPPRN